MGKTGNKITANAQKAKKVLDKVSPSFCLAKWLQVSIHLPTGRTHSCYHPTSHKIPLKELKANPSALHNTEHKKKQRHLMLEGKRPAECSYCWKIEDLKGDHLSDRHYRSAEPWAISEIDVIKKMPWDFDVVPRYIEVNFNQACQFKCSYCSPQLSSSWMKEIKQEGFFPSIFGHNRPDFFVKEDLVPYTPDQKNPYVEAFWKWWPKVYSELRVFRMTGGEPLIDPNTFKVLEYAKMNPNPNLELSITSNMCPPQKQFDMFFDNVKELVSKKNIKSFFLYASIDSIGSQAEYIRNGLNYEQFTKNVDKYLSIPDSEISFILTFTNLAVGGLKEYLKWIIDLRKKYSKTKQRISLDTPFLRSPDFFSLQILTDDLKKELLSTIKWAERLHKKNPNALDGLYDFEIAKLKRVYEWAILPVDEKQLSMNRADFCFFVTEHDRRRNTNFKKTFPGYTAFMKTCQKETKRYKVTSPGSGKEARAFK